MSNIVDLKQITKLNAINKHTYTAPLALFLDQKNQKKKEEKKWYLQIPQNLSMRRKNDSQRQKKDDWIYLSVLYGYLLLAALCIQCIYKQLYNLSEISLCVCLCSPFFLTLKWINPTLILLDGFTPPLSKNLHFDIRLSPNLQNVIQYRVQVLHTDSVYNR